MLTVTYEYGAPVKAWIISQDEPAERCWHSHAELP